MIPVLETERLILRGWHATDLEPFARFYSDGELSHFVGGPLDYGSVWRLLATEIGHWILRGYGMWVIEEKGGSPFAGYCGLWEPGDWPELEIGWIFNREFHGKGYATEAALRVREYAYGELKRNTLVSYIDPENEASKRVARRLGASYESTIELRGHPAEIFRHPGPKSIN
jgi:RimJ/RimL family protein N-acetyltransferase